METPLKVQLFVDILNECLYFFVNKSETVCVCERERVSVHFVLSSTSLKLTIFLLLFAGDSSVSQ
jgi:hypothetical protein